MTKSHQKIMTERVTKSPTIIFQEQYHEGKMQVDFQVASRSKQLEKDLKPIAIKVSGKNKWGKRQYLKKRAL